MALAHAMHRHNRSNSQDDVAYGGDVIGVESMASGSVTSFVRKLFQMVQAECDSVVGFVADGTAFEVKDPRRLEQDILPKYFRHSRFQSLVRQLNFYSFKKISKERSVWIYKHAFFRRDEPELLHALKRKTNQSGARFIGHGMMLDNEIDCIALERARQASFSRVSHNTNSTPKPGLRTLSVPRQHHPFHHPFHHNAPSTSTSSSSFDRTHNAANTNASRYSHRSHETQHVPTPARPGGLRPYHASNSRSAGGGPSTGGVGGAVAPPCYSRSRGASSRAPGYGWAGAGGHPVSAGGRTAGPAEYGDDYNDGYGDGGMVRGPAHLHGDSLPSTRAMPSHAYGRRESAAADDTRGVSSKKLCSSSAGQHSTDREQALALWGLSALCQVASATEATSTNGDGEGQEVEGGCDRGHGGRLSGDLLTEVQQRSHHCLEGGEECPPKRPCRAGFRGERGREGVGNGRENEPMGYEEGEEDGVTSAERDDSVASFRSRSASVGSESASSAQGSPRESPVLAAVRAETYATDHHDRGRSFVDIDEDENDCEEEVNELERRGAKGSVLATGSRDDRAESDRKDVLRSEWEWHSNANEPAFRPPGSFVDRRMEEKNRSSYADADRVMMANGELDDDEESIKTEAEDVDEDEDDEKAAREERATIKVHETHVAVAHLPRDLEADMEAEAEVGLEGIGHLFSQLCVKPNSGTPAGSVYLATVTNSGDSGLREIAVFCAGPAGHAPDMAPLSSLAEKVSSFLWAEEAIAQDLRVYAEALDPSAVDVVGQIIRRQQKLAPAADAALPIARRPHDDWKLLRVFCRYAACRLGRAHEVTSVAAASEVCGDKEVDESLEQANKQRLVAERVTPRLDDCRWKWWRAAVRFS